MKPATKRWLMISGAIITMLLGAMTAIGLVGKQARLVDVATIYFTAFGGGAGLVSAIRKKVV